MDELARCLLEEGVLGEAQVEAARAAARDGDLASAALELGLASEAALVRALARLHECQGIDLSGSALPTALLDAVAAGLCAERRLLPLAITRSELTLAMADPEDLATADEVRFFTGKRVVRCAAVATSLRQALEGLVRARADGLTAWRGEGLEASPEIAAPHLALHRPSSPPGAQGQGEPSQTLDLTELASEVEEVPGASAVSRADPFAAASPAPPAAPRASSSPGSSTSPGSALPVTARPAAAASPAIAPRVRPPEASPATAPAAKPTVEGTPRTPLSPTLSPPAGREG